MKKSKPVTKPIGDIRLTLHKWQDGAQIEEVLDAPDRWSVHEADTVDVSIYGTDVKIIQKPKALRGTKMGGP